MGYAKMQNQYRELVVVIHKRINMDTGDVADPTTQIHVHLWHGYACNKKDHTSCCCNQHNKHANFIEDEEAQEVLVNTVDE
jgi:hypothetical protein